MELMGGTSRNCRSLAIETNCCTPLEGLIRRLFRRTRQGAPAAVKLRKIMPLRWWHGARPPGLGQIMGGISIPQLNRGFRFVDKSRLSDMQSSLSHNPSNNRGVVTNKTVLRGDYLIVSRTSMGRE
jgi:hypothetical protein